MVDTAAIVAAGFGSRLNELTAAQPKGFLQVGGRSLIERSVQSLIDFGIERIVIGTGYRSEHYDALAEGYRQITTVKSHAYATTGSMYTLWNMREELDRDFLLLESDLLYEPRALAELLAHGHEDVVLASDATASGDEVFIEHDDAGRLVAMSKDRDSLGRVDAELVGITRISSETYRRMCALMQARLEVEPKLDYEYALVHVGRDRPIKIHRVDGLAWCEIDDADHLRRAYDKILPRVEAGHAERDRRRAT